MKIRTDPAVFGDWKANSVAFTAGIVSVYYVCHEKLFSSGEMPRVLIIAGDETGLHPKVLLWLAMGLVGCFQFMLQMTQGRRLHEISCFMSKPVSFDTPFECVATMAAQKEMMSNQIGSESYIQKIGCILWLIGFLVVYSSLGLIAALIGTLAAGVKLLFQLIHTCFCKLDSQ